MINNNRFKLPVNKYSDCYIRLINSRLDNLSSKYCTEKHHIYPICVFGSNNIVVNLTHREHYMAHLLLYKAYLTRYNPKQVWVTRLKKTLDYYRDYTRYNRNLTSREFHTARVNYYKSSR